MRKQALTALMLAAVFLLTATSVLAAPAEDTDSELYILDHQGQSMTCRALLAQVQAEGAAQATLLAKGQEVDPGAWVATGQTLRTYDEEGALIQKQTVVIRGDVTGTGTFGLEQVAQVARALNDPGRLDDIHYSAADVNGSGALDVTDLVQAAGYVTGQRAGSSLSLTQRSVPIYMFMPQYEGIQDLFFADPGQDIPYISLVDLPALIAQAIMDTEVTITEESEGVFLARRVVDGVTYWVEFNFNDNTIVFLDYDAFLSRTGTATILDVISNEAAWPYLTNPAGSYERHGIPITIDLDDYNIELIYQDGAGYMPLQTLSDVFTRATMRFLYNGEAAFAVTGDLGALEDLYYSAPTGMRSPELATFTYNELCLALDINYGLKTQHDITDFRTLCLQAGLSESLQSVDPVEADSALAQILHTILSDLHSSYGGNSYLVGREARIEAPLQSYSWAQMEAMQEKYANARKLFYPDGAPGYEEVGNTAYVTFDNFSLEGNKDYSTLVPTNNPNDTIELIMYAHSQIMRDDSPVENVVIDLSNNTGGVVGTAVCVISWYLGGTATLNQNSSLTHAQASTKYGFDVNQDGIVDENDTVASKRLFCLTSPVSFSCGNIVPSCFKASDSVTMIGKPSSGGACMVGFLSTASGTLFSLSSNFCQTTLSNGSYYDVDKGVEVDVPITVPEHFYDRELLGTFLNGIYR